jgi:lycopene cyclase domain-containing protein
MAEYTILAVLSVFVVVISEVGFLRTGVFRRPAYWITMAICFAFMIPVNGWLTKLSAPIVLYSPDMRTGWRFPLDIPVEDFAFGFSLLTLVVVLWLRRSPDAESAPVGADRP